MGFRPSTDELLERLRQNPSVLNGWDVVLNLSLDHMNKAFKDQFEALKSSGKLVNSMKFVASGSRFKKKTIKTEFDITLSYPELCFPARTPEVVKLTTKVEGKMTQFEEVNGKKTDSAEPVSLGKNGEILEATILLGMVEGRSHSGADTTDRHVLSIVLNLAKGDFTAKNMGLDDETNFSFNKDLKSHFTHNPVQFILNSIDMRNHASLDALTPSSFIFKTLTPTTSRKPCLQVFIRTGKSGTTNVTQNFLNDFPEPIPEGADCSILISDNVFFNHVLPTSVHQCSVGQWTLEGVPPGQKKIFWSSQAKSGYVYAKVDPREAGDTFRNPENGWTTVTRLRLLDAIGDGLIDWDVKGLTFSVADFGRLAMNWWPVKKTVGFEMHSITYGPIGGPIDFKNDIMVDLTISAQASVKLLINGSGRDQKIAMKMDGTPTVSAEVSSDASKWHGTYNRNLGNIMKREVPGRLQKELTIDFKPISVFVLQNLLFPDKNYITLHTAKSAGTVLLLGKFAKEQ